jgi:hypothetical protein
MHERETKGKETKPNRTPESKKENNIAKTDTKEGHIL